MSNNRPKNQHIIPQGYQSFFCNGEGKISVYDVQKCEWLHSQQPYKQFREKDFQTLFNYEGLDPYVFEKEFAKQIEDPAIKVIRDIISNKKLPDEKQFSYVLNLMGLLGMRNPISKSRLIQRKQQKAIGIMDSLVMNKDFYNHFMKKRWKEGVISEPVPYEKAKDFVVGRKFRIEVEPDQIVMKMLEDAVKLTDLLSKNNWLIVEATNCDFLSSNHPVNVLYNGNPKKFSPAYVIAMFPLSSRIALIGSSFKIPAYRAIDNDIVDGINYCTAYGKTTKLFASKEMPLPSEKSIACLQAFLRVIINLE